MPINCKNISILVNGSGIVADSVSFTELSSTEASNVLGYKNPINFNQNGPYTANFNISYYVELNNEVNYSILNQIKNTITCTGHTGINIEIGGMTGYNCYLNSYSFAVIPNELIKATVNYTSYKQVSGILTPKKLNSPIGTGLLAHSWTAILDSNNSEVSLRHYALDYSAKINWTPIWELGTNLNYPSAVQFIGGEEAFSIQPEKNISITNSGAYYENIIADSVDKTKLRLYPLKWMQDTVLYAEPNLVFDLSGSHLNSKSMNFGLDSFVNTSIQAIKYF